MIDEKKNGNREQSPWVDFTKYAHHSAYKTQFKYLLIGESSQYPPVQKCSFLGSSFICVCSVVGWQMCNNQLLAVVLGGWGREWALMCSVCDACGINPLADFIPPLRRHWTQSSRPCFSALLRALLFLLPKLWVRCPHVHLSREIYSYGEGKESALCFYVIHSAWHSVPQ